ncbi:MAG: hypothetical protein AB7Q37_18845 [Pyrinomonadaceae bacterium]
MNNATVPEIQRKTEIIKAKFVELSSAFESETGTHLHLSVHHDRGSHRSEILTCEVKVPEVTQ